MMGLCQFTYTVRVPHPWNYIPPGAILPQPLHFAHFSHSNRLSQPPPHLLAPIIMTNGFKRFVGGGHFISNLDENLVQNWAGDIRKVIKKQTYLSFK